MNKAGIALVFSLLLLSALVDGSIHLYRVLFECPTSTPLSRKVSRENIQALHASVEALAETIGERSLQQPTKLKQTVDFLEKFWTQNGFHPQSTLGGSRWVVGLPGSESREAGVAVAAHYDSPVGSGGADDNASGVAVLLELSKQLKNRKLKRNLYFVAYEEATHPIPLENWPADQKVDSVLILDGVGRFKEENKTQTYASFAGALYPTKGNFLALYGNFSSRGLLNVVSTLFTNASHLSGQCLKSVPHLPPPITIHQPLALQNGMPTVLVTDTGSWRDKRIGTAGDKPSLVDYEKLEDVLYGMAESLEALCNYTT